MTWVKFNPASQGAPFAECVKKAERALRRRGLQLSRIGNDHTFQVVDGSGQPFAIDQDLRQVLLNCPGVDTVR